MTTTEVNCSEQELIAKGTFTSLLSTSWQYNISDARLELYTDQGETMLFAPTSYP